MKQKENESELMLKRLDLRMKESWIFNTRERFKEEMVKITTGAMGAIPLGIGNLIRKISGKPAGSELERQKAYNIFDLVGDVLRKPGSMISEKQKARRQQLFFQRPSTELTNKQISENALKTLEMFQGPLDPSAKKSISSTFLSAVSKADVQEKKGEQLQAEKRTKKELDDIENVGNEQLAIQKKQLAVLTELGPSIEKSGDDNTSLLQSAIAGGLGGLATKLIPGLLLLGKAGIVAGVGAGSFMISNYLTKQFLGAMSAQDVSVDKTIREKEKQFEKDLSKSTGVEVKDFSKTPTQLKKQFRRADTLPKD